MFNEAYFIKLSIEFGLPGVLSVTETGRGNKFANIDLDLKNLRVFLKDKMHFGLLMVTSQLLLKGPSHFLLPLHTSG